MTEIQTHLAQISQHIPAGVRLVAVSKFHPIEKLREAYDVGQRCFGESQAQELQKKAPQMPADTEWHFIGHLQKNKVKAVVPIVTMIHAVDSLHLLQEIDRQAERFRDVRLKAGLSPCVKVLWQLHIAQETTKFGLAPGELSAILAEGQWRNCKNVEFSGLMCMATNTDDTAVVRQEFQKARECFEEIRQTYFHDKPDFRECSWGMTADYPVALECGSTIIRIGSGIFGEREY